VENFFISDIIEELAAAKEAGMQTALAVRPGNAPLQNLSPGFTILADFNSL
jgi:methionine salvage enolase-phosphatase E1